jgi:hypothetical protein
MKKKKKSDNELVLSPYEGRAYDAVLSFLQARFQPSTTTPPQNQQRIGESYGEQRTEGRAQRRKKKKRKREKEIVQNEREKKKKTT